MRYDEIEKQMIRDSKYWALKDGDVLRGYFENDDFRREVKDYNGTPSIRYYAPFTGTLNTGDVMTKEYGCSGNMVKKLSDSALMLDQSLLKSKFAIKRSGMGQATEYNVQVIGKKE